MKRKQGIVIFLIVWMIVITGCLPHLGDGTNGATPTFAVIEDEEAEAPSDQPTEDPTEELTEEPADEPEEEETEEPADEPSGEAFASQECINMVYISDVTIPDGTQIGAGESFIKTWMVMNNGCQDWPAGTRFVHVGGNLMGGPAAGVEVPVTFVGDQMQMSLDLVAPETEGTYRGYWQMIAPDGLYFGDRIYLDIRVGGGGTTPPDQDDTTPEMPDLAVTLIVPGGSFVDEQPFHFTVTVTNQGGVASTATDIGCELVDAGAGGTQPLPAIPPGGSTTVQCGYTADPGTYTFRATADMAGSVTEAHEGNNDSSFTFTIAHQGVVVIATMPPMVAFLPDLVIRSIKATQHEVYAVIENQGLITSNPSHLSIEIDYSTGGGLYMASSLGPVIPSLAPGQTITLLAVGELNIPAGSNLELIADWMDEVNESDETNNLYLATIP